MTVELQRLSNRERALTAHGPPPTGAQAMRATLSRTPFSDPNWIFERKLDGILFDLLWRDGSDLRALGLRTRKRLLAATLRFEDPLRRSAHRNGRGEALYEEACRRGWERIIAKRGDSPYECRRSRDWLKFKCEQGQEFVVGGYTAPRGTRTEFGALLLGYHDEGRLHYAGKVGTGFDGAPLRNIGAQLRRRRVDTSPFHDPGSTRERGVSWVAPELVAQMAFIEWTGHGRLRHPRFLGLRDDKPAGQVVREG